jgi:hypothetical protein
VTSSPAPLLCSSAVAGMRGGHYAIDGGGADFKNSDPA